MKKRILALVLALSLLCSGAAIAADETPNASVLEHNLSTEDRWINVHNVRPSEAVKAQAEEICAGAKTDMEKLRRIYNWVADNIYYDMDWYTGIDTSVKQNADGVLENRRGVCDGYASLVEAMAIAVGIPCVESCGFALGAGTGGVWTQIVLDNPEPINHAWNEAWVDGRWVTLDTTWGSQNTYAGGEYFPGKTRDMYFDPDPAVFALDHKIARRGEYFDQPSSWAKSEIFEGMTKFIYPSNMVLSYQRNINRSDFSKLMIYLIEAQSGMSIEDYMAQKGVTPEDVFPDAQSPHIQAAYALGIVKGKVGSGTLVTKEEERRLAAIEAEKQEAIREGLVAEMLSKYPELTEAEARAMLAGIDFPTTDTVHSSSDGSNSPSYSNPLLNQPLKPGGDGSGLRFDPNGAITRQEAAIMLANCARLLGVAADGQPTFTDDEDISSWAAESVRLVASLEDGAKTVMGDTGGGAFKPLEFYTSEQAQISALRLFNCATK